MQKDSCELQELLNVAALMAEPVIACDQCGQLVYANLAAKTLFGKIDMEQNSMEDCSEALGIFDCQGERPLDMEELPLAQAVYEGRVVQANLVVRQNRAAAQMEATAFPVLDRNGRQIGAMMVCRSLGTTHDLCRPYHLA